MKEVQYKNFSLRIHNKNWRLNNPNICQFELTFGCNLHCKHCYADCYNRPAYLRKELETKEIKFILDKVYRTGVIWLCFTGGDPLTRRDFLDIYSYAKEKGFIITVFTNGYSTTKEIAKYFKKKPPFVIEMTLNAVTENLYEKISQVKGSFAKVMKGIDLILKERLPLKIKTEISKDNLKEISKIKEFIRGLGLKFRPNFDLYARLNGNLIPCSLRISPEEALKLNGRVKAGGLSKNNDLDKPRDSLFRCAISGGDGFHIDPYGNTFPCTLIRKPSFNLLKMDIEEALNKLLSLVEKRKFTTNSKCSSCNLREFCGWCPGKAHIETGDMESPIEYCCELTQKRVQGF